MSTFHCWSPNTFSEDEHEGKTIEGDDPQDAAETYAEQLYHSSDPFQDCDVHVRVNDTIVEIFNVQVEYSPSFWGHKKGELQSNVKPDRDTSCSPSQENPDAQDDLSPVLGETEAVPTVREPQGG